MVFGRDQIVPFTGTLPSAERGEVDELFYEKFNNIFRESANELDKIINETESEFIIIGSSLRDFYNRVMRISEMSSTITNVFSSDEIITSIDGLNDLLNRIKGYQEKFILTTRSRIEQLDQMLKIINKIYEPLSDFQNNTITLRTLSTTSKIQSALIGDKTRGFDVLANDVKRLSMLIDAKSDSITNDLNILKNMVSQSQRNLLAFEKKQNNTVEEIINHTEVAVSSLKEKYDLSKSIAQEVSGRADDISHSIADLVTSLQFHDITRQNFEQLRKSVQKTCDKLEMEKAGTTLPFSVYNNSNIHSIVEKQCAIFISSLSNILDEFIAAVYRIINNIALISTNIDDILKETRSLIVEIDSEHKTFIAEFESSLSFVASAVSVIFESAETDKELSFAIKSLSNTTGQITEFIHDIKKIAADLKLISLNATIKAEEIGTSGASLTVVSDFIRQMAEDSNVKAYDVSEALESITNAIRELSSKAGKWFLIDESDANKMSEKLSIMNGTFQVVHANIFNILKDFEKIGRQLATDMQQEAENIDVHITVDKIVRDIVYRFKPILQYLEQTKYSKGIIENQEDINAKSQLNSISKAIAPSFLLHETSDRTGNGSIDSKGNVELF